MGEPHITIETPTTTFGPTEMQALASFKPTRPPTPAAPVRRTSPPGWLWGLGGLVLGTAVAATAVHYASHPAVANQPSADQAHVMSGDGFGEQEGTSTTQPVAVSTAAGAVNEGTASPDQLGRAGDVAADKATAVQSRSNEGRSASTGHAGAEAGSARSGGSSTQKAATPVCSACGVVESVETIHKQGEGTGAGAVAGGVVGGVVGNQFGRTARYVGAIGGAIAGHQIEKHVRSETLYQVRVRMDDGEHRSLTRSQPVAVGTHVTVQNGVLKVAPHSASSEAP